ncbi:MAG: hypothetical protein ABJA02_05840 [Acidobacteriota bacterium]
MRKSLYVLGSTFLGIAFIVIVIGSYVIVAQTAVSGEWRADTGNDKNGRIHLNFDRSSGEGHRNQFGSDFSYDDLQGLSREQAANGKANFRLVREAGTIECEGSFTNGKGSGTFRFTPASGYLEAMRSRGFDFEKDQSKRDDTVDDRLLSAALINVTTALADDLASADLGRLDVDDLFKAAIFKVDSKFIAEMKATGFPDLKMEDLVKARIFKIDAAYVRQVHEMGFAENNFEGMVKFRIFKITPEFLGELKAEGLANLSSEDVVKCRIFNIDGDFIRKAKASEPNVTVEELVQMRIGVRRIKTSE